MVKTVKHVDLYSEMTFPLSEMSLFCYGCVSTRMTFSCGNDRNNGLFILGHPFCKCFYINICSYNNVAF
jgi:hypothetical protein